MIEVCARCDKALWNQQVLDEWQLEVNKLCKLAGVGHVKIIPDRNDHFRASINGNKAYFGPQILQASPTIRNYVIAHKLGHKISFHEKWFWTIFAVVLLFGFLLLKYSGPIGKVLAFAESILLMWGYSFVKGRWMVLEWQADAAGSTLLAEYLSSNGNTAMLRGMSHLRDIRSAAEPKSSGWYGRYYASKINKLSGKAAQAWVRWNQPKRSSG